MIVLIPLLVALIGVLAYALSNNGKVQEIGRIMFFTGLLVWLWNIGSTVTGFLK